MVWLQRYMQESGNGVAKVQRQEIDDPFSSLMTHHSIGDGFARVDSYGSKRFENI